MFNVNRQSQLPSCITSTTRCQHRHSANSSTSFLWCNCYMTLSQPFLAKDNAGSTTIGWIYATASYHMNNIYIYIYKHLNFEGIVQQMQCCHSDFMYAWICWWWCICIYVNVWMWVSACKCVLSVRKLNIRTELSHFVFDCFNYFIVEMNI